MLQAAEGVVSVEPAGASLHLFLSPGKTSVEALQSKLNSQNLGPAVFRPITPSLEDVFMHLTGKTFEVEDEKEDP